MVDYYWKNYHCPPPAPLGKPFGAEPVPLGTWAEARAAMLRATTTENFMMIELRVFCFLDGRLERWIETLFEPQFLLSSYTRSSRFKISLTFLSRHSSHDS